MSSPSTKVDPEQKKYYTISDVVQGLKSGEYILVELAYELPVAQQQLKGNKF
jgi:hypothetical protein